MQHPQRLYSWGLGRLEHQGAMLWLLTECHLIHSPLFLHAGHCCRLLLVFCGQRGGMKLKGTPAEGMASRCGPAGVASARWGQ